MLFFAKIHQKSLLCSAVRRGTEGRTNVKDSDFVFETNALAAFFAFDAVALSSTAEGTMQSANYACKHGLASAEKMFVV